METSFIRKFAGLGSLVSGALLAIGGIIWYYLVNTERLPGEYAQLTIYTILICLLGLGLIFTGFTVLGWFAADVIMFLILALLFAMAGPVMWPVSALLFVIALYFGKIGYSKRTGQPE